MMDPPIKLFGQTIAFTSSASSQDDTFDAGGTTSTGAWEELSSSPQDLVENAAESGAKSEMTLHESASSCFPELSSSGSNCEEEKLSSPHLECHGLMAPADGAAGDALAEDSEDLDVEDRGLRNLDGTMSQEGAGDESGAKGAKLLRRPDKAVACPRCHSLETKFCYYNNYNVNQPRHFCKHCQRYWTAGGTLRNVPVGAGRRKNKHANVMSPRQTSEVALVRGDAPDVAAPLLVGKSVTLPLPLQVQMVPPPTPRMRVSPVAGQSDTTGVTLPYPMRMPSLEGAYIPAEVATTSDTSLLGGNLAHLATPGYSDANTTGVTDMGGGWHAKDESACSAFSGTCGSTLLHEVKSEPGSSPEFHNKEGDGTAGWSSGGAGGIGGSHGASVAPYGFFNGAWPYGYNVGWSGGAAFCAGPVASPGNSLPPPPGVAGWTAAGSMWTGVGVPWPIPGLAWSPAGWGPPWSMAPWAMGVAAAAGATVGMSPPVSGSVASCSPTPVPFPAGAPTVSLGKHGRTLEGGPVEGAIWAPKSLRMADPEEAMRSSVWRILGVKSGQEQTSPSTFKASQPKTEGKKFPDEDQQAAQATLHANPAAMSRSIYFHESN